MGELLVWAIVDLLIFAVLIAIQADNKGYLRHYKTVNVKEG